MNNINLEQLLAMIKSQSAINDDANKLANELICEYGISNDSDIAEFLGVNPLYSAQKAVRVWTQNNLPIIDKDETYQQRYRQLRHLFQQAIPDFM